MCGFVFILMGRGIFLEQELWSILMLNLLPLRRSTCRRKAMSDKIKKLIAECKATLDGIDCTYYGKDEITIDKGLKEDVHSGIEYVESGLAKILDLLDTVYLEFQQALIMDRKKEKG